MNSKLSLSLFVAALLLLIGVMVMGRNSGISEYTEDYRHAAVSDNAVITTDPIHLQAQLVRGSIPEDTTELTILTDESCQPDEQGISHCINRATTNGEDEVILIQHHSMAVAPCLTPGEVVAITLV